MRAHWQERLGAVATDAAVTYAAPRRELGLARAFLGRDPDGHAFQIVER